MYSCRKDCRHLAAHLKVNLPIGQLRPSSQGDTKSQMSWVREAGQVCFGQVHIRLKRKAGSTTQLSILCKRDETTPIQSYISHSIKVEDSSIWRGHRSMLYKAKQPQADSRIAYAKRLPSSTKGLFRRGIALFRVLILPFPTPKTVLPVAFSLLV